MKKYFLLFICSLVLNSCGEKKLEKAEYKIIKEEDTINCIKPNSIKGINRVFIKNDKNEDVYMVEILGGDGSCIWERDKLVFKEGSPILEVNKITASYDNTLYLDTKFKIAFRVKKLLDKKINIENIKIPYFVIFSKNNQIIKTINQQINIDLSKIDNQIQYGNSISFKQNFSIKEFNNVEILTGIYFKK